MDNICEECNKNVQYINRCICEECILRMSKHELVKSSRGHYIDKKILPLIEHIWNLNVETTNSCQDNRGCVWIEFIVSDFHLFLRTLPIELAEYFEGSKINYVCNKEEIDRSTIGLRFPKEDLEWVLNVIKK